MVDLKWIESNGGPLVLMPTALLSAWSGTDLPSDGRVLKTSFRWDPTASGACDYDRACELGVEVGVLSVGSGWGLVLGDDPSPTTWLPRADGGYLVRWVCADTDAAMARALELLPSMITWEERGRVRFSTGDLELFDAAEAGAERHGARHAIALKPGEYAIAWARYMADRTTEATMVRLAHVRD